LGIVTDGRDESAYGLSGHHALSLSLAPPIDVARFST